MYGGGFHHGQMSYGHKKSSFIVQNDIILVTFNYRGGPFGNPARLAVFLMFNNFYFYF